MTVLEYSSFPHIVEQIILMSSPKVQRVFRQTGRPLRSFVDKLFHDRIVLNVTLTPVVPNKPCVNPVPDFYDSFGRWLPLIKTMWLLVGPVPGLPQYGKRVVDIVSGHNDPWAFWKDLPKCLANANLVRSAGWGPEFHWTIGGNGGPSIIHALSGCPRKQTRPDRHVHLARTVEHLVVPFFIDQRWWGGLFKLPFFYNRASPPKSITYIVMESDPNGPCPLVVWTDLRNLFSRVPAQPPLITIVGYRESTNHIALVFRERVRLFTESCNSKETAKKVLDNLKFLTHAEYRAQVGEDQYEIETFGDRKKHPGWCD
jgi:hypothetical protein